MILKLSILSTRLVFILSLLSVAITGSTQVSIVLSDTVSFNSSEVGETANRFGIGNRAIALLNHYEGKTLIYSPINEFRDPTLRREFYEYSVRHINLSGSISQGPIISRQFANSNVHFSGTHNWIGWTALESPLGSEAFPQLITEVYDEI